MSALIRVFMSLQGREVFSGQPENEDGYMKLGISQYQAIDKIVCLSKQVSTWNLKLVGTCC